MATSILSKILYKKQRVGMVQRDGKVYVKYVKEWRFRLSRNAKYLILTFFIVAISGLGFKLLLSEIASTTPSVESAEVVG